MTILSENLRTIRKKLNCTQMALSEVLEIGFRTYVRYEAGERDAPVSVMVKLAKLGKVSLDRLLTTEILLEDLDTPDQEKPQSTIRNAEVIGGGIEEGRLMFKGLLNDNLVTNNKEEQKLKDKNQQDKTIQLNKTKPQNKTNKNNKHKPQKD